MPSCEKCWNQAGGESRRYRELLKTNDCTPEEQAGGEDAKQCPECGRMCFHMYAYTCMNSYCESNNPSPHKGKEQ